MQVARGQIAPKHVQRYPYNSFSAAYPKYVGGSNMRFNIALNILLSLSHVAFGLQSQDNITLKTILNHENDPCGDPYKESMTWTSIGGKVVKVLDGDTVIIATPDKNQVKVHLVGIGAPEDSKLRSDSRLFLEKMALNTNVDVVVNPSYSYKEPKPNEVTGIVHVNDVKDANLAMIESGMARYKAPNPYEMSGYIACRYKKAEDKAREEKRGLWQSAR
jgi:micrococcal nuclease